MRRLRLFLEMIKFSHTLFALPFAIMAAFLAARGWPPLAKLGWILLAMAGARTAAMSWNRLADEKFDRDNPRTANRHLPRGLLSRGTVLGFSVLASALLVFAAARLNRLCFALSPVALSLVLFYSFTKRFTSLSHFVLGLCLALAPIGAWIAIRGSFGDGALPAVLLGGAVLLWTAGFDLIYSCQDLDFDRRAGLHSLPKTLGIGPALALSAALHAVMMLLLAGVGLVANLRALYFAGLGAVALLLAWEHRLVRPNDLSKVNVAFFTLNGCVSLLLMLTTVLDRVL